MRSDRNTTSPLIALPALDLDGGPELRQAAAELAELEAEQLTLPDGQQAALAEGDTTTFVRLEARARDIGPMIVSMRVNVARQRLAHLTGEVDRLVSAAASMAEQHAALIAAAEEATRAADALAPAAAEAAGRADLARRRRAEALMAVNQLVSAGIQSVRSEAPGRRRWRRAS